MKIIIGVAAGAAIGFAAGHFGRCATGTCPLTRNPWASTLVGDVVPSPGLKDTQYFHSIQKVGNANER